MKKIFPLILTLLLVFPPCAAGEKDEAPVRGVWVASVSNLDYPSAPGLSDSELKAEADELIETCADLGMNAVFFQVRPCADALYSSSLFPQSLYLTEKSGYGDMSFDPLAYMTEKAHQHGMELHAWINPYRVTNGQLELEDFSPDSPQRLHPEYLLTAEDGTYFFNPALQEVRDLIVAGITEIIDSYPVDGIHFDDYFYPEGYYDDGEFFAASGAGDIDQWRRDNVNALVKQVSGVLRERGVTFGISPRGVWENSSQNPRGSDTRGNGSYSSIYCDSLRFIDEGWVDYICPQIYWNIGYSPADYEVLARWWSDAVSGSGVKLYVGMADYRTENAPNGSVWQGSGELRRQLEFNKSCPSVSGEVHFRYGVIAADPLLRALYKGAYADPLVQVPSADLRRRLTAMLTAVIKYLFK